MTCVKSAGCVYLIFLEIEFPFPGVSGGKMVQRRHGSPGPGLCKPVSSPHRPKLYYPCVGGDALVLCTWISPFTYLLKTQIANAIILSETGGVGVGTLEDLSRGYSAKWAALRWAEGFNQVNNPSVACINVFSTISCMGTYTPPKETSAVNKSN